MHQKCNIPVALPSVLIIEGNEGGTLCVFDQWTGDGCMVPCSRMGEEKEEEEEKAQFAEEGIKEQVSLERKEKSKLSFQVFPFPPPLLSAHAGSFKDAFSPALQHQHLKQVLCVEFGFNLSSSPAPTLFFNLLLYLFIPELIGAELMERCDIIWKQCERGSQVKRGAVLLLLKRMHGWGGLFAQMAEAKDRQ